MRSKSARWLLLGSIGLVFAGCRTLEPEGESRKQAGDLSATIEAASTATAALAARATDAAIVAGAALPAATPLPVELPATDGVPAPTAAPSATSLALPPCVQASRHDETRIGRDTSLAGAPGSRTMATAGDLLLLGIRNLLLVIDIRSPGRPAPLACLFFPGPIRSMLSADGFLYVADGQGIAAIDLADPWAPEVLAELALPNPAILLSGAEGLVFAADSQGQVHAIDVSDPAAPLLIQSIAVAPAGQPVAVHLNGATAFAILDEQRLRILDLAKPLSPVELFDFPIGSGGESQSYLTGSESILWFRYETERGDRGLDYYAMFLPDQLEPHFVSSDLLAAPSRVELDRGYAFMVSAEGQLYVLDLLPPRSRPTEVEIVGPVIPLAGLQELAVSGNHLYVWGQSVGLSVIDVTSPLDPRVVGSLGSFGL
jgi:hypothetical protein